MDDNSLASSIADVKYLLFLKWSSRYPWTADDLGAIVVI